MRKLIFIALLAISCDVLQENGDISGCIDSMATNYNIDANVDDNSCEYLPFYEYSDFESIQSTDEFANNVETVNDSLNGSLLASGDCINYQLISNRNFDPNDAKSVIFEWNGSNINILIDGYIKNMQITFKHNGEFLLDIVDKADYISCSNEENISICNINNPDFIELLNYSGDFTITKVKVVNSNDVDQRIICHTLEDVNSLLICPIQSSITIPSEDLFEYSGDFEIVEVLIGTTIINLNIPLPAISKLGTAYPNPFDDLINITFSLAQTSPIDIYIVDRDYNKITTLVNSVYDAGLYNIKWNSSNYSNKYYRVIADFGDNYCFINLHKSS